MLPYYQYELHYKQYIYESMLLLVTNIVHPVGIVQGREKELIHVQPYYLDIKYKYIDIAIVFKDHLDRYRVSEVLES